MSTKVNSEKQRSSRQGKKSVKWEIAKTVPPSEL